MTHNRTHVYLNKENANWLCKMEQKGISKSSLVNLAIDILKPRLSNVGATDQSIFETILHKKINKHNTSF